MSGLGLPPGCGGCGGMRYALSITKGVEKLASGMVDWSQAEPPSCERWNFASFSKLACAGSGVPYFTIIRVAVMMEAAGTRIR